MWKTLSYFPPPTSLLKKTLILLSFKDNILYKARYWSNGILQQGEQVGIHVKFPSTHLNSVSNPLNVCLQNDTRKCLTERAPNGCRPDSPPHPGIHCTYFYGAAFLYGTFPAERGLRFPELSIAFQKH